MIGRQVTGLIEARETRDGAGVGIRRVAGIADHMDPFLLLDEIRTEDREDVAAGFPAHPHRGFETLTYVRTGGFVHEDSLGNRASVGANEAQWMRAGSGIVHSEMPLAEAERFHGFQLWINLPSADKMSAPAYRDIRVAERQPHDGVILRPVTGTRFGSDHQAGAAVSSVQVFELELAAGAAVEVTDVADLETVLAYVFDGAVEAEGQTVTSGTMAVFSSKGVLRLSAPGGSRMLVLAGQPIREPVVQHGPFVMNSVAEIEQAMRDYRDGRLDSAA